MTARAMSTTRRQRAPAPRPSGCRTACRPAADLIKSRPNYIKGPPSPIGPIGAFAGSSPSANGEIGVRASLGCRRFYKVGRARPRCRRSRSTTTYAAASGRKSENVRAATSPAACASLGQRVPKHRYQRRQTVADPAPVGPHLRPAAASQRPSARWRLLSRPLPLVQAAATTAAAALLGPMGGAWLDRNVGRRRDDNRCGALGASDFLADRLLRHLDLCAAPVATYGDRHGST
jgi:hypothetical protein